MIGIKAEGVATPLNTSSHSSQNAIYLSVFVYIGWNIVSVDEGGAPGVGSSKRLFSLFGGYRRAFVMLAGPIGSAHLRT